jgi:hypothetical protein
VCRADNLTTFTCRFSRNLGASTSWKPKGLSWPVMGLLCIYYVTPYLSAVCLCNKQRFQGTHGWYGCIGISKSLQFCYHWSMRQVCHLNFYMQGSTSQHPPLPFILHHRPLDLSRVTANKVLVKNSGIRPFQWATI